MPLTGMAKWSPLMGALRDRPRSEAYPAAPRAVCGIRYLLRTGFKRGTVRYGQTAYCTLR